MFLSRTASLCRVLNHLPCCLIWSSSSSCHRTPLNNIVWSHPYSTQWSSTCFPAHIDFDTALSSASLLSFFHWCFFSSPQVSMVLLWICICATRNPDETLLLCCLMGEGSHQDTVGYHSSIDSRYTVLLIDICCERVSRTLWACEAAGKAFSLLSAAVPRGVWPVLTNPTICYLLLKYPISTILAETCGGTPAGNSLCLMGTKPRRSLLCIGADMIPLPPDFLSAFSGFFLIKGRKL